MERPLIAIVGPTASGKSGLALRLALERQGEIVSCDSLQVYRGLDIGSAKPSPAERAAVPHHLLDVVDPGETFSAADYARLARAALRDIAGRGRLVIVAGGTGLYFRALVHGLFEGPARDEEFRRRVEALAMRFGDRRLHRLLARVDPAAAARIQARDRVRVVRALEVYRATRRSLSDHHRDHRQGGDPLTGFDLLTLALSPPRAVLRSAVERRTRQMIDRGLVAEVRGLLGRGLAEGLRPLRAIGYRQAVDVVAGRRSVEDAERDIVTETMRYAKRQWTWFRHQAFAVWCDDVEAAHARAAAWLEQRGARAAAGGEAGR